MRVSRSFKVNSATIKSQLLQWASEQDICCLLNSNRELQLFEDNYSSFDFIVAAGVIETLGANQAQQASFSSLKFLHNQTNDWLFGYFTYDLKNEIENLSSNNFDGLNFPAIHFFQPRYLLKLNGELLMIDYLKSYDNDYSVQHVFENIIRCADEFQVSPKESGLLRTSFSEGLRTPSDKFQVSPLLPRISKTEYLSVVDKIKQHIQRGDIYEMNYCMEFFSDGAIINPTDVYHRLNEISPMPFSCYYKNKTQHLACASPERFLSKRGNKIISQPMKGTIRRGRTNKEDKLLKEQLKDNQKERSENVMIVDLVRNDLARTAKRNSVKVEDAMRAYSFRQLHQMISTVTSEMKKDIHLTDVLQNAFPMGSMTGAPKISAMQLIEQYEVTKRGLYSGSVGYITPNGDFDFNVVIRSILYNEQNNYLSFMVGSAITAEANGESEYEECLLKAKGMIETLKQTPVALAQPEYREEHIGN